MDEMDSKIMNISVVAECTDEKEERDQTAHQIYQILVPSFFILIILIGVIGNVLVICLILSSQKLRTITNILLLNLAISDLAFLLICGSFSTAHYVLTEWPLGPTPCQIIQYLLYVTCYVTVYTLVAVSGVRYVAVVHGLENPFIKKKRNAVILIVILWTIFLLAKIPILLVHGVTYNDSTDRLECIISGKVEGQNLFGAFFIFAYIVPLTAIATLSVMIVRHLRSNSPIIINPVEDKQSHVTKILAILTLTFAVCWLPLHIHLLMAYYGSIPDTVAYKFSLIVWHGLIYVNSMLNPIIYNCFSADFRQVLFGALICRRSQENQGDQGMAV